MKSKEPPGTWERKPKHVLSPATWPVGHDLYPCVCVLGTQVHTEGSRKTISRIGLRQTLAPSSLTPRVKNRGHIRSQGYISSLRNKETNKNGIEVKRAPINYQWCCALSNVGLQACPIEDQDVLIRYLNSPLSTSFLGFCDVNLCGSFYSW